MPVSLVGPNRTVYGSIMGITHVTTTVWNLTKSGSPYEAEFLVDTGAIDCLAPSDALLAAGVTPEGRAVYELANGQPVEYEYGFARVAFMGEETVAQIVFGPADAEPILGVVALENTGVVVDPVTKTLKRIHARPLK
jgi:clan AA aspartic protease